MDWQPIETAPKDSTWILVSCPEKIGSVLGTGMAVVQRNGDSWSMDCYDNGDLVPLFNTPTHWMPLPEPPKGTKA